MPTEERNHRGIIARTISDPSIEALRPVRQTTNTPSPRNHGERANLAPVSDSDTACHSICDTVPLLLAITATVGIGIPAERGIGAAHARSCSREDTADVPPGGSTDDSMGSAKEWRQHSGHVREDLGGTHGNGKCPLSLKSRLGHDAWAVAAENCCGTEVAIRWLWTCSKAKRIVLTEIRSTAPGHLPATSSAGN